MKSYEDEGVKSLNLADLVYTLDSCRTHFAWRSFAVLIYLGDIEGGFQAQVSAPVKAHAESLRLGFVFSGQGAQWFVMGRELIRYVSYNEELEEARRYIRNLGCTWSISGNLHQIIYAERKKLITSKRNFKDPKRLPTLTNQSLVRLSAPSSK